MPRYEISSPDGRKFEVTAPEGASQAEVLAYAQANFGALPAAAKFSGSDLVTAFKSGAVGSTKAITDVAGADNAASQALGDTADKLQTQYSPARQAEMRAQAARMKTAESSGSFLEEIKAGVRNVSEAPLQTIAQGVGSFVPYVPAMLLGPVAAVAGLGARTVAALSAVANAAPRVMGTAQGIGAVKGSIYDTVYQKELESGVSETDARAKAALAQEYTGKNIDQMALAGVLGYVAGSQGIERLLTPKGAAGAPSSLTKRVGRAALEESITEAPQGGQERMASNIALQREGYDTPTFQGVAGQAVQEGLTGALSAGPIAALRGPTPERGPANLPGVPPEAEAAAQAARVQRQTEQRLKAEGVSSREGEALLAAEETSRRKTDKESEARAQQAMQADYAQRRSAREAELSEAFPADYSDVMNAANRYGVLATELASLDGVRKTADIRSRIEILKLRMADVAAEDDRAPNEFLRMQQDQLSAAKAAGFPAEKAAAVFANAAPIQLEMRDALGAGTLPPQTDLRGNPVAPKMAQPEGLADVAAAELPLTSEVLRDAGIAPTHKELEAAGQQQLGLRRTPTGQPTSPTRDVVPQVKKETPPLPVTAAAPVAPTQPGAITTEEIRQFGVLSKANRTWLTTNVLDKTPSQVRDFVDANPTLLSPAPVGLPSVLQVIVKEIVANATPKGSSSVQPATAISPKAESDSDAEGSKPSVGVPSALPPADPVGRVPAPTPSAKESAPPVGRGLDAAGQPTKPSDVPKGAGEPALNEDVLRTAEAAEVKAALTAVEDNDKAQREAAPAPYVTAKESLKSAPTSRADAPADNSSPFDVLKKIKERRAKEGRASEAVAEGQSLDSMKQEIAQGKGMLYAALRRAIASGKVVLKFKDARGNNGGFFDGRIVTLYADGIPAGQVLSVALHEVGAHMGFKKLFGARVYDNIIKQIQDLASSKTPSLDRTLAQDALKRIPESDIARGEEVYGDETIAYFIEVATNAQNAGALPKSGPVRALFNNIRLAMLAAVNRTFGSKLGVADLSTQDILSMAEGAFIKESFTAISGVVDADSGRDSATAAKILGVDALDIATQDAIAAIQAAMPKLESNAKDGILAQGLQGVANARKKAGTLAVIRQGAMDKFATVESKVSQMFSQGVRDFFGNLNPMVLVRQAEDSAKIVLDFFRHGGISLTKEGLVSTTIEKQSMASALTKVAALGVSSNLTYDKAKEYVSTVLEGHRLSDIRKYNNMVEQEAVSMEALGQNKAADDKRDTKILMHMTGAEIDTLENAYQNSKAIQDIQADLNATRTQAIDFMVASGRITADKADFWKENASYVPFSRIFEDAPTTKVRRGQGMAVMRDIPEMKGSLGRPVENVLDAYANRLGYIVEESMKNYAAVALLDTMSLGGYAKKLATPQQAGNKNLVVPKLFADGKAVYYELQNEYDLLAFQQMPEMTNWLVKGLAATSRVLRTSVTAMPPFALKQVIDDAQRAMFTSGVQRPLVVGMKTLYNLPRTFFGELTGRKSPLVRQLESFGVIGDFDSNIFKPTSDLEAEIGAQKRGVGKSILHRLEQFTKSSDLAARLAVYEETLLDTGGKKQPDGNITGGDTVLAQTRSRELINFSRKGTSGSMRLATQVIPFFNAYAQGLDVLYRAASGIDSTSSVERSAARKMFISRIALMAGMGTLYALAMSDDEGYKNASEDVRDNNWILPNGYKLPVPRELGFIFKSIPERVVDYMRRSGTPEEQDALKAVGSALKAAVSAYGSPLAIPSVVRPILENMANYSFFMQRELEPKSTQGREPGYRSTSSTSELAKAIGEYSNVSPIKIDNMIRGVFGMMGSTTLLATDALINPTRPDRPLYQMPFTSIFLYDTIGGKAKTEFYDLRSRVAAAVTTYNALESTDPDKAAAYGEKNASLLDAAPDLNRALKDMNDLGRMRRLLEQGTEEMLGMTGAERRTEIDEIRKAENESVMFVREMETALRNR